MIKVSIIIPVVHEDKIEKCIKNAIKNAGIEKGEIELIAELDHCRIGCPEMVKRLVKWSKAEIIAFIGDDTIPKHNWLKNALKCMAEFEGGWGLVAFNDLSGREFPTHFLAHKKLLPYLGGEFFHTGYWHCYCDNELYERCKALNRYKYASNAVVLHRHPVFSNRICTGDYERVYSQPYLKHDSELYQERMLNGWRK